VQFVDDIKPLQDTQLYRLRGLSGVEWAMPLYKGLIKARMDDGTFQTCNVLGIDDATMIGGPPMMIEGALDDLRRADSVIVDDVGAATKLARRLPDGTTRPLQVGDTLELNDNRAVVVGICRVSRTFQSQPVIYTTYSRATRFAPRERRLLSFVLVKSAEGQDLTELARRIESQTGLKALTNRQFKDMTIGYYLRSTGIPINFGITVALGFIVGTAIAGQTFYNFTLENLRHFGALKAMGAGNGILLRMIALQALTVGTIGYGLGVGLAAVFGLSGSNSELAFLFPWQLLVGSAVAVTLITVLSALLSLRRVARLEPGIVFK
jgi:putative ABC transport system permease protein